jgi:hypothetical protein
MHIDSLRGDVKYVGDIQGKPSPSAVPQRWRGWGGVGWGGVKRGEGNLVSCKLQGLLSVLHPAQRTESGTSRSNG